MENNWCIKLTEENKNEVISYLKEKYNKKYHGDVYYYGVLDYQPKAEYTQFATEINYQQFKEMVANEKPFLQGLINDTKEFGVVFGSDNKFHKNLDLNIEPKQIQSDGGSTPYYQITITNDKGETFNCELNDVLRDVFNNQWDLCNIVKASRRISEARQGKGKKDVSIKYDANKIIWFAEEIKKYGK